MKIKWKFLIFRSFVMSYLLLFYCDNVKHAKACQSRVKQLQLSWNMLPYLSYSFYRAERPIYGFLIWNKCFSLNSFFRFSVTSVFTECLNEDDFDNEETVKRHLKLYFTRKDKSSKITGKLQKYIIQQSQYITV